MEDLSDLELPPEIAARLLEAITTALRVGVDISGSSIDSSGNTGDLVEESNADDADSLGKAGNFRPLSSLSTQEVAFFLQQCQLNDVIPIFEAIEMDGAMLSQVWAAVR